MRRTSLLLASLALAFAIAGPSALASPRPGSLDDSFGKHGKVLTNFGGRSQPKSWSPSHARSVAIDASGRIVVGGGPPFAVARYKPSGKLDPSFSDNGKARAKFATGKPPSPALVSAVAIAEDGKIVAVGAAGPGRTRREPTAFAIARFRPNGHLDRSFANNGKLRLLHSGGDNEARAVAIDDQGRILIAGKAKAGAAIIRLLPNGEPDRSFAGNGGFYVPGPGGFNSIAIDSSDRIVVGSWGGYVYRYEPDGEPDLSFGDGGRTQAAGSIALDRHDRILVARGDGVTRLDRNGFGDLTVAAEAASSVALDPRQRVVAFGATHGGELAVSRYLPDLDYDDAFDTAIEDFPGKRFLAGGVAVDSQDRVVGVGGARQRFALARLHG